jgi:hypothetical protein
MKIVADGLTKELCISAYLVAKRIMVLYRKSGPLFVALYLKQCATSLQRFYGEGGVSPGLLSVPLSLTRTGLPRILPAHHRRAIIKSDSKADMLVKLYLSLFSLSRVILLAKKVSKATFANIVQPADPCMELIGSIKEKAKE